LRSLTHNHARRRLFTAVVALGAGPLAAGLLAALAPAPALAAT